MRVLVFESKRLGYDSSWCFAEMICRGLEQCGVSVKRFILEEDIAGQERELRKLTEEHFDGMIDINSLLPHVLLDDRYFPDYFDAPFFQFIVVIIKNTLSAIIRISRRYMYFLSAVFRHQNLQRKSQKLSR